jgi:hypothetical protein
VKERNLEGLVVKHTDSRKEPGQRSGAWQKMRVNQDQGFVIEDCFSVQNWLRNVLFDGLGDVCRNTQGSRQLLNKDLELTCYWQ